jgi:hypothetical protein
METSVQDKLLLFIGNWFVLTAEGTTAIVGGCLLSAYFGLLSALVIIVRTHRGTTTNHDEVDSVTVHGTHKLD